MDLNEKLMKGLQLLGDDESFPIQLFSQLTKSVTIKLTENEGHIGLFVFLKPDEL